MDGNVKEGRVSIWTDILLILVLTKFVLERFTSHSLLGSLAILIFVFFLGLRSRFIQKGLRTSLSIAAVAAFMGDILILKGPNVFAIFLLGIGGMIGFYLLVRRFLGFFFK